MCVCVFVRYARGKISDLVAVAVDAGSAAFRFEKVTTNFETQPEHRLRPSTSTSPSLFADNREFIVVLNEGIVCVCVVCDWIGDVTSCGYI